MSLNCCPRCYGSGRIPLAYPYLSTVLPDGTDICPNCKGSGLEDGTFEERQKGREEIHRKIEEDMVSFLCQKDEV